MLTASINGWSWRTVMSARHTDALIHAARTPQSLMRQPALQCEPWGISGSAVRIGSCDAFTPSSVSFRHNPSPF